MVMVAPESGCLLASVKASVLRLVDPEIVSVVSPLLFPELTLSLLELSPPPDPPHPVNNRNVRVRIKMLSLLCIFPLFFKNLIIFKRYLRPINKCVFYIFVSCPMLPSRTSVDVQKQTELMNF